jgi:hypothetical protein
MKQRVMRRKQVKETKLEYSTNDRLNKVLAELKDKKIHKKLCTTLSKERAAYPETGWVTETNTFRI